MASSGVEDGVKNSGWLTHSDMDVWIGLSQDGGLLANCFLTIETIILMLIKSQNLINGL
jgi:hypothetical protein